MTAPLSTTASSVPSLLSEAPLLRQRLRRDAWVYHEHRYYQTAPFPRLIDWRSGMLSGSKLRLLMAHPEVVAAKDAEIHTTCTPHSNQVRQLAALRAALDHTGLLMVYVTRDDLSLRGEVCDERTVATLAANLRFLYDHVHVYARFAALPQGALAVRRGVATDRARTAAAAIGHELRVAIETGAIAANPLVVLTSGSGTTAAGIARGLNGTDATVVGLTTRSLMVAPYHRTTEPHAPLLLVDRYATLSGACDPRMHELTHRWASRLDVELDVPYCARVCHFLSHLDSGRSPEIAWNVRERRVVSLPLDRPIVVIATGNQVVRRQFELAL